MDARLQPLLSFRFGFFLFCGRSLSRVFAEIYFGSIFFQFEAIETLFHEKV